VWPRLCWQGLLLMFGSLSKPSLWLVVSTAPAGCWWVGDQGAARRACLNTGQLLLLRGRLWQVLLQPELCQVSTPLHWWLHVASVCGLHVGSSHLPNRGSILLSTCGSGNHVGSEARGLLMTHECSGCPWRCLVCLVVLCCSAAASSCSSRWWCGEPLLCVL